MTVVRHYSNKNNIPGASGLDAEWAVVKADLQSLFRRACELRNNELVRKIDSMIKEVNTNKPNKKVLKSLRARIEIIEIQLYGIGKQR